MAKVQLFLTTPRLSEAETFAPLLAEAIKAAKISCVLVRLGVRDEGSAKKILKALAPIIQDAGVAMLVEGEPSLAARANADGAQISGAGQNLRDAIDSLKPERIVGVCGLKNKDDAMTAGELDVDYLMFGEPSADGFVQNIALVTERVKWWAEIFNVPCVAYAPRLVDVGPLTNAGADFIATGDWLWNAADGVGATMAKVSATILANMPVDA